jgi:hypothetical protein
VSSVTFKHKVVQIRKDRTCYGCLDKFRAGQEMVHSVGTFSGDFFNQYLCKPCDAYLTNNSSDFDDGVGRGDLRGEDDYEQFKERYYRGNDHVLDEYERLLEQVRLSPLARLMKLKNLEMKISANKHLSDSRKPTIKTGSRVRVMALVFHKDEFKHTYEILEGTVTRSPDDPRPSYNSREYSVSVEGLQQTEFSRSDIEPI